MQPFALSNVIKEVAFRGVQMDVMVLQFWVALFQFFVGFAMLPLTSLPLLGGGEYTCPCRLGVAIYALNCLSLL